MPYELSFLFISHVILLVTDYIFQLIIVKRKFHGFFISFSLFSFLGFHLNSGYIVFVHGLYASDLMLVNNFKTGTSSLSLRFIILELVCVVICIHSTYRLNFTFKILPRFARHGTLAIFLRDSFLQATKYGRSEILLIHFIREILSFNLF